MRMHVKQLFILAVLLALLFVVPSALAGGWAVVTLDQLPAEVRQGQSLRLGFMVRQHGNRGGAPGRGSTAGPGGPLRDRGDLPLGRGVGMGDRARAVRRHSAPGAAGIAGRRPGTRMPNLGLSRVEIEALIAFINNGAE